MDNFLTFLMTKKGIMTVFASVSTVTFGSYQFNDFVQERTAYERLDIQFSEGTPTIEYGNADFDLTTLIASSTGDVTLPVLDVTKVGEQTLTFKVSMDGQEREFTKVVKVQDTQAPKITLASERVTLSFNEEYDVSSLVESVSDPVDGAIARKSEETAQSYYEIEGSIDTTTPGEYVITVKAVDKNGNESSASATIIVKEKEKTAAELEKERLGSGYTAPDPSVIAGGVVSIATSYNGAPYAYGGNSPETGFDCSGFVQYVFGQAGVSLPRTAGAQGAGGTPVASADMQPGDVVVYNGGSHVAIYVGGGQIVHALNPSLGVRITGMSGYGTITAVSRY